MLFRSIEITKKLRQEKVKTPIMIITAKNQEYDKIIGLELGADDYLTKPFSPREVIARLKAIERRMELTKEEQYVAPKEELNNVYVFEDFTLDLDQVKVLKDGVAVKLTPKEFELLAYFVTQWQ